ncbi:RDD family protein [Actinocrispum sp. NPDC049592]|uniref:RDD family protein n=1 Tax=Actinocrispum sp. NPDC049592 TaxID=3154835 RepID=UPI00343EB296
MSKKSVELVAVRSRDLRKPPTASSWLPPEHGGHGDPRYPSPTGRRAFWSFVLDMIVHLGLAFGVAVGVAHGKFTDGWLIAGVTLAGFVGFSIVDRIIVQWALQATVGKLITGLRLIRKDNGGRAPLWVYVRDWLLRTLGLVAFLSS